MWEGEGVNDSLVLARAAVSARAPRAQHCAGGTRDRAAQPCPRMLLRGARYEFRRTVPNEPRSCSVQNRGCRSQVRTDSPHSLHFHLVKRWPFSSKLPHQTTAALEWGYDKGDYYSGWHRLVVYRPPTNLNVVRSAALYEEPGMPRAVEVGQHVVDVYGA